MCSQCTEGSLCVSSTRVVQRSCFGARYRMLPIAPPLQLSTPLPPFHPPPLVPPCWHSIHYKDRCETHIFTVAILAQGTHRAIAAKQALNAYSNLFVQALSKVTPACHVVPLENKRRHGSLQCFSSKHLMQFPNVFSNSLRTDLLQGVSRYTINHIYIWNNTF